MGTMAKLFDSIMAERQTERLILHIKKTNMALSRVDLLLLTFCFIMIPFLRVWISINKLTLLI